METLINVLFITFSVLLGVIVGSFLGAAVWRLKKGKSMADGRSICPSCKKQLDVLDLIPLFSFIFLQGKCRYCNKKISAHYFVTELLTAVAFGTIAYSALLVSPGGNFLSGYDGLIPVVLRVLILGSALGITAVLVLVAVYDLWYMEVPEKVMPYLYVFAGIFTVALGLAAWREEYLKWAYTYGEGAALLGALVGINVSVWSMVLNAAVGAGLMFIFFFGMNRLTKGKGMGFGDVVFAPAVGLWLGGVLSLIALLISFILGSIVASAWALIKYRKIKGVLVPYLPFLCASALLVFVFSADILKWLVNYLVLW